MDFVVLDTEGNPELSELAIIDSQGRVIYEAFSKNHPNNTSNVPNLKTLRTLLTEFLTIVRGKKIVCHYAKHDIEVLQFSFRKAGLIWQNLDFECTWTSAKKYWLGLESYSLEYLSLYLNLRVHNRYFIRDMAHTARYDAEFTYALYCQMMIEQLKHKPNPFSSSRVDTPFQKHPDYSDTYRREFLTLASILNDIKQDSNHQSKGVVVIGEPGSGKTHLMMRLAQERLSNNRLLFIRHPNNPNTILYHVYSRILESLVQRVDSLTQLDYLIINSFQKIPNLRPLSRKDQEILKALEDKNLDALGTEGTQRRRDYWQHIEKRINEWWVDYHSAGSYALSILKGIAKYCSYTSFQHKDITTRWLAAQTLADDEADKVGLPNWRENLSQEAFSLEAISVLGKLSILDEPLIIIFDQLEVLGLPHNKEILDNFGQSLKEIFTHVPNSLIILNMFPDRWDEFKKTFDNSVTARVSQYEIHLRRPAVTELKEILKVKLESVNIALEQMFSPSDLEDILEQQSIREVLNRAADYYNYKVREIPLPIIKKSLHKPDSHEQLQQQLRVLQQQQQVLTEICLNLMQEMQKPGYIDLDNLRRLLVPDASGEQIQTSHYIIEYLIRQKAHFEQQYYHLPIISDSDDIGKLRTIAEAFNYLKPIKLTSYRLGKRVLPEHIVVETDQRNYVMGFLQTTSANSFRSRIDNFNQLVISHPKDNFYLFRDQRLTEVKSKGSNESISQLNNSQNGKFMLLSKQDRIHLELIYQLIIDVQNRDLDVDLESALNVFLTYPEWYYWLFDMFGFNEPVSKK
ncbi:MAG: AAA family ATPase [Scytonema sp. PMC 1069.18]|nr:AAA family ATPase [Scytonema sp. PMC 1069.18]MEC4886202.1 AAA family ATPase [Scytonema sp. PMC 1070.18]